MLVKVGLVSSILCLVISLIIISIEMLSKNPMVWKWNWIIGINCFYAQMGLILNLYGTKVRRRRRRRRRRRIRRKELEQSIAWSFSYNGDTNDS